MAGEDGATPVGTNTPNVVEGGGPGPGGGCITVPAIRVLEALSRPELQAVADFRVSRPAAPCSGRNRWTSRT